MIIQRMASSLGVPQRDIKGVQCAVPPLTLDTREL